MTYDELEALILEGGDGWAVQRALAPLDEKARAKLSAPVQKLYRQLGRGKPDPTASDRLAKFLDGASGMFWMHRDFSGNKTALITALYAVGPRSALIGLSLIHYDLIEMVMRDRRPDWIDDWVAKELEVGFTNLKFSTLREWIRDGVCAKPDADGYYRLFAGHMMRRKRWGTDEVIPPISRQLLADPDLLPDVEGLFRVESIAFGTNEWMKKDAPPDHEIWPEALEKLSVAGHLDRADLLQWSLDGLTRELKQPQLAGFHSFHKRLKPNRAEHLRHQQAYIDLLCHPVGHVTRFALEMLAEIQKTGDLQVEPVLRELPVVFGAEGKGNAIAALKLLKRIAGDKVYAHRAAAVSGEALRHANADVQGVALDLLENHRGLIDEAMLGDMEPFIAATQRVRFGRLLAALGGGEGDGERGPEPVAIAATLQPEADYQPAPAERLADTLLRSEDVLEPIQTVDALIEAVFHAAEVVEGPDEVERIIDAISRLAGERPADFNARVAPLLHRMASGGGGHSIVLGSPGLGGSLRNLLNVWLTGLLNRTVEQEAAYFRVEEAFIPLRTHLSEIAERVHRGQSRPLLSAPTHKGGWIDPMVWMDRLEAMRDPSIIDSMDFRLSLLRLAPDRRAEALGRVAAIPQTLRAVAGFALGGDTRPTASDQSFHAAWITAARCRDPLRDWSAELAPLRVDDAAPDGIRSARYSWLAGTGLDQYGRQGSKVPKLIVSVESQASAAPAAPNRFRDRIAQAFVSRRTIDRDQLPSAALNRLLDRKRRTWGELATPWVAQWACWLWPQNPAAACMRGAVTLVQRIDDNASSWSPSHGHLQVLFQPGRPWREPGHLLLCVALIGKDADARGLAVDALIEGIETRLFDPALFAATLAGLAEGEWVKLNRLGDALVQVIPTSPTHASVISAALQLWLPRLDFQQNNAFRLLEVLLEAKALNGQPLGQAAQDTLAQVTGSGRAAKIARQLAAQR